MRVSTVEKMEKSDQQYFNTAAAGLVPKKYVKAVHAFQQELTMQPSKAFETWLGNNLDDLRYAASEFLEAEKEEIAFVPNFSYALNALVHSLKPKSRVLVLYEDYPSLIDPFRINGFDVQRLKSNSSLHFNTEGIMVELLARKIEVLAISHVQWLSGFKVNLEVLGKFCRERGILMIVDATQSMGSIPVSLRTSNADVIISSGYKWMNAGFGSGILCATRDFLEQHHPRIRGNNSRMIIGKKWDDDAAIVGYEPGHHNVPGLIALQQALQEKLHTGTDRINNHNMMLTKRLIEDLDDPSSRLIGPISQDQRSSIIALKGGEELFDYLSKHGFVVSMRNGLVRISIHYHNTEEGVDELVKIINQYSPTRSL